MKTAGVDWSTAALKADLVGHWSNSLAGCLLLWTATPPVPHKPRPAETLFDGVRATDRSQLTCELRFHGESCLCRHRIACRGPRFPPALQRPAVRKPLRPELCCQW